jgi:hypothetical protein
MALREIGPGGKLHDVLVLEHQSAFERVWLSITLLDRTAIEAEINRRLDQMLAAPDPNWGSITNTSIEGGRANALTGIRGDWSGTVFQPIFNCFGDEQMSGMFYGNVWKKVIIDRDEHWIGIRSDPSDPTFPQRGITLQGKTYFIDNEQ